MNHSLYLLLCILVLLTACQTARLPFQQVNSTYCSPTQTYRYTSAFTPRTDIEAVLEVDTSLTNRFSHHSLLMINALGLLPTIKQFVKLSRDSLHADQSQKLQLFQQLHSRLLLATTEISSLAAELDCEGERAEQLAYYLDQQDVRRIRNLTISSIVAGAVTTVATALISTESPNKIVGIGGGVISAVLGGLAAFSSDKQVVLIHQRNLLTDIWNQPKNSAIYPPFIWYVLNEKAFSNSGAYSIAYNIRLRWNNYVLANSEQEKQSLYFGAGGKYTSDELHTRANMLNQLQSSVRSINQDLQSLQLALTQH